MGRRQQNGHAPGSGFGSPVTAGNRASLGAADRAGVEVTPKRPRPRREFGARATRFAVGPRQIRSPTKHTRDSPAVALVELQVSRTRLPVRVHYVSFRIRAEPRVIAMVVIDELLHCTLRLIGGPPALHATPRVTRPG